MQNSLGNDSSTETINKLLEAMTAQSQMMTSLMQTVVTQNQQLIVIVDQNSQLMNQVQSLIDLIGDEKPDPDKPQFMDD
ncbi:hypothetical protein [Acinetobacter sp. ANC 3789]|uniref:hypothetical protein n=1 Tax=Acinetobacter sp. ANC 3789 TaxID=1217714 RepID=UPI0003AB33E2|nr:hypothetical protein [Acinetobacter sp. ANC 3789]